MSEASSTLISSDNSLNELINNVNVNDTSEDISDSILNEPNADSSHKPRNKRKQKKHCKRCDRNKTQQGILQDHFLTNEYFNKKKTDAAVKLIQSFINGEGMYVKLCFFNACYLLESLILSLASLDSRLNFYYVMLANLFFTQALHMQAIKEIF